MAWEFITTLISVAIFIVMLLLMDQREPSDLVATANLLKVVYGLLSFPFMIFAIPLLAGIITKTRATRYDSYVIY